ncbi:MAG TPA: transketolase, partial [Nitrospirae bacterium]|nr:transketolase [Nitrospirota bacterium]
AASLAGHLGLGNLIYLYSDNKITIEGSTDLAFTEDVAARFRAYGWHVQGVDGNDLKAIERVIREAKREKTRPSLIVARTHIAYGSPNKEGTPEAHGAPLGEEEVSLSKKNLGWPETPRFYVPGEALKHMKKAVGKGRAAENKWTTMTRRYRRKYPDLYNRFLEFTTGNLPDGWDSGLPEFRSADGPMATRSASGKVLNVLAGRVHNIIGGSADLAPSNNTYLKSFPVFGVKKKVRNIHFGVREHAMGAALNGMALTGGIIPYGGTFLIFSDYMRPAIRLASLMKQHVIYVFTHDSIALGEDGPTHQPVEQLSSLRSIPNFTEIRPADANETREAWKIALQHGNGPVALILTRQKVPVIDRKTYASEVNIRKGAYILADSGGKPELIILASGSEVHLAIEAYEGLVKQGMKVRVVNMASFRLFDGQSERYKKKVLPDDCRKRLAVEAGSSLSWYKYVGIEGDVVGVDRFGASAPYKVIYEKFGLTVDNIVRRSIRLLKK